MDDEPDCDRAVNRHLLTQLPRPVDVRFRDRSGVYVGPYCPACGESVDIRRPAYRVLHVCRRAPKLAHDATEGWAAGGYGYVIIDEVVEAPPTPELFERARRILAPPVEEEIDGPDA